MIKDIEQIGAHNPKFIREFIRNCHIEEKIDAHYITIEILSRDKIRFVKGNGYEIDRVDHILNSMWNQLLIDWQYLMLCNPQWFALYAGHSIRMFYLPCSKPIETAYPEGLRYIIDTVEFNGVKINAMTVMADLRFPDTYKVDYKRKLVKVDDVESIIAMLDGKPDDATYYDAVFSKLIGDRTNIYAIGEPEGIIYKYGSNIYQYKSKQREAVVVEKTSYEFILCQFMKYLKSINYMDRLSNSYVKTVCTLFNGFIIDEQGTGYIARNVEPTSLEAPCIGMRYDIGFEYIPDPVTKQLCRGNILYSNIFKILLANLRRKKNHKRCTLMNMKQVEAWNTIVSVVETRSSSI